MPQLPQFLADECDVYLRVWRWPQRWTRSVGGRWPAIAARLQRERLAGSREARLVGTFVGEGFLVEGLHLAPVPYLVGVSLRAHRR